jgi:hypothetical protein
VFQKAVPFKKSGHEMGRSSAENIQMVPFALAKEHISFYLSKIFAAVSSYNESLSRFAEMASCIKTADSPLPDHLQMDVKIMNYCLENMAKTPYSPATGAFAVQLRTATSRVKGGVEKVIGSLSETIHCLIRECRQSEEDYGKAAEELGFKVRWRMLRGTDSLYPVYAAKKVVSQS